MDKTLKVLVKAVHKNNLGSLEDLLREYEASEGPSGESRLKTESLVNMLCQTSGDSLCHVAAQHGFLDILRYLVERKGAMVDIRNKDRKTPLHNAAQFTQVPCLEYLLNCGADVNAIKQADWTPVMLACTKTNADAVSILLKWGADPFYTNKEGWNSFHIACRTGCLRTVKILVEHVAARAKTPEKVQAFCDSSSRNGRTPLHTAALHGNVEVATYLVKNGLSNVSTTDTCGTTPLMDACRSGSVEMVDLLLQNGASLDVKNKCGYDCMHVAAEAGTINVITHLFYKYNFSLSGRSIPTGLTPLDVALKEHRNEAESTLRALLKSATETKSCPSFKEHP